MRWTLPQYFKQQGYTTQGYGKIFHNPWPDNVSWSKPHAWPKSHLWSDDAKAQLKAYKEQLKKDGRSPHSIDRLRALATEIVDIPDEQHIDGAITQQAIEAMRQLAKEDKPFFLAAGFVRPHLPFVVPRKYWQLYDGEAIPVAENPALPQGGPSFAMNTMYELRDYMDFDQTADPKSGSLSLAQQRRLKHGYLAAVSFIDAQVGKLLAELDALGLTENTVVVLWSDHGWKLGEHNSWCKQSNYEIDARVPLIISAPGFPSNGKSSKALVELLDVYPTLCDLTGLPIPTQLEGKSLQPLLKDPEQPWSPAAFNQFPRSHKGTPLMGYAMRTERYRYIEWQDRRSQGHVATELYDHQNDPTESTNIAANHEPLIEQLSKQMWATLPTPPAYVPPKKARPQMTFYNKGNETLTLFWLPEDGEPHQLTRIAPGKKTLQKSSRGHRFKVTGPGGFEEIYEVTKGNQTVELESE